MLINPIKSPFQISLNLPGSKSIALRQLAISALCEESTTLQNITACEDVDTMLDCLQKLGIHLVREAETQIRLDNALNKYDEVTLNLNMSGVSTRLLLAIAALRSGLTRFDGHPSLQARTNKDLLDVLKANGISVTDTNDGYLPTLLKGPLQRLKKIQIRGNISSQYISALLLISSQLERETIVAITGRCVSKPYIDITLNEMHRRGVESEWLTNASILIPAQKYIGGSFSVEGDASAATYFAALATIHSGSVLFSNLGQDTYQGDYKFFQIMEKMGATVNYTGSTTSIHGPDRLKGIGEIDLTDMPDAALTLITMAPLLPSETLITGLESLRHKECNRLCSSATELKKLGIVCHTGADYICIGPRQNWQSANSNSPITLSTYNDHRMAMALSVLASCRPGCSLDDANVVCKTYPDYWQEYNRLLER